MGASLRVKKTPRRRFPARRSAVVAEQADSGAGRVVGGVGDLRLGEAVEVQAHGLQLDAGDLLVEFFRQGDTPSKVL
jgi:hypothetical protein